jgi:hypothetical protein
MQLQRRTPRRRSLRPRRPCSGHARTYTHQHAPGRRADVISGDPGRPRRVQVAAKMLPTSPKPMIANRVILVPPTLARLAAATRLERQTRRASTSTRPASGDLASAALSGPRNGAGPLRSPPRRACHQRRLAGLSLRRDPLLRQVVLAGDHFVPVLVRQRRRAVGMKTLDRLQAPGLPLFALLLRPGDRLPVRR